MAITPTTIINSTSVHPCCRHGMAALAFASIATSNACGAGALQR